MQNGMTFPGSALPKLRFVAVAAAFATLYFAAAELTTTLAGDVGVAILWPASGVYLGVMLVAPRQLWPALAVGAGLGSFAAYAHAGSSLDLSVAFAVPSSAEGLLGAVLIERIVRGRFRLGGLHDVSALVIGAAVAVGVVALSAGAVASQTLGASFAGSWLRWWSADALGVLAVAPLVVALAGTRRRPSPPELRYAAGVVAVVSLAIVLEPSGAAAMVGGALALPLLLWAGWRWGPRAAAVGGAGVALAAVHLASGSDLLGGGASDSDIHVLQAFIAALLVSSLSFAAAVADWRREQTAAARSSRRLRAITDSSPDGYVTVNGEGVVTGWSARARAMFGMEADDVVGRSLERLTPGVGPICATPDARELTLLGRHSSGREFPAALTVRPGVDGEDGLWHVFIRDLSESERLGKELDRAQKELKRRGRARDEARSELRDASQELRQASRRIEQLRSDLAARERDLRHRTSALSVAERDLDAALREADRNAGEAERLRADHAATEKALEAARADRAGMLDALEDARVDRARLVEELEAARADSARAQEELEAARSDRARLQHELEASQSDRSRALDELDAVRAGGADLLEELRTARADSARLSEELAAADEALEGARAETERVAEELRAAEGERRLAGRHSAELIARYDERGVCLYASPGAVGLLAYEPDELVGRPGADLVHPDDRARLLRARAGQAETTFRARLRRSDGDYVLAEVSFRPDEGDGGRLGRVTTVARPVAEHSATSDGLRVAETRFQSLFGTLPHASALIDHEGRIRRANLAFSHLTGYSRDQLEGAALGTLVDERQAAVFAGRLHQIGSGQVASLRLEQELIHAGGRTIAVELSITPLPAADAAEGRRHDLIVHVRDLGAGRDSEAAPPRFGSAQTAA